MIRVCIEGPASWRDRLEAALSPRFAASSLADLQDDERPEVVIAFLEHQQEALPRELLELTAMPLLILTDDPLPGLVSSAFRAGARGVLPADAETAELSAAIEAVAEGLLVIHSHGAEGLFSNTTVEAPSRPPQREELLLDPLTKREIEVLRLLALGLANKEIAARLNLSEHTVKYHVASLMGKLGAGTRTEAVTTGLRLGLILL